MSRPKVGLLLLTAEWFAQIGAHGGSFSAFPGHLAGDAEAMEKALSVSLDVISSGIAVTRAQVADAVASFTRESVDAVVVCHLTWAEDWLVLGAVEALPTVPLLLWCYSPFEKLADPLTMPEMLRASGPVGTLQASGPLKRLQRRFGFAFGSYADPAAIRSIVAFARAAQAARALRRVTIGVLPYRCDQMTGTYVDEFRLRHELGPALRYISTHDYLAFCEAIPATAVEAFVTELSARYALAPNTTLAGLRKAARVSLGLAELVRRYDLDAIAIEDVGEELHRVVGLRPCLPVAALFDRAVVSMEAEIGGAVALLLLRMFSGGSPMYTEIFTVDPAENAILIGHAGMHNAPALVEQPEDILVEPDGEYVESEPDSAWMRFRARGGHVTLLSVFCDVERFKLVISSGECVGGPPRLLGSPHAYVRLGTPLASFFEAAARTGMTQHWALVHADVVAELQALAGILDLECVVI